MVSVLTRILGIENLDLAEDIVQEVLLKALNEWSYRSMPDNPSGWMMQVAKNKAIDHLRRTRMMEAKTDDLIRHIEFELRREPPADLIHHSNEVADDELRMIFTCCHPALT